MAVLQLHRLNLNGSHQRAALQVSLRYNLFLICPPPPHLSMCAALAELQRERGLSRNVIDVAQCHGET